MDGSWLWRPRSVWRLRHTVPAVAANSVARHGVGSAGNSTEQCLRGNRTERHDKLRGDHRQLGSQPRLAGMHMPSLGPFMNPALAALGGPPPEVLDGVGDVARSLSIPASTKARSSSLPAGPTNGSPRWSSTSPGCSPTNMADASVDPAPNTVCDALRYSSQPRHPTAAVEGQQGSRPPERMVPRWSPLRHGSAPPCFLVQRPTAFSSCALVIVERPLMFLR